MAAHPRHNRSPFRTSFSSSSPRGTIRMASSPPPLPLFSDGASSASSSLRSKTSATSGHSKLQRSSPSFASTSRHEATLALSKKAQLENDSMVYLDGPQVYTCGQCRTHLTSHDDIISKSFHGRKGEWKWDMRCWCLLDERCWCRFSVVVIQSHDFILSHCVSWDLSNASSLRLHPSYFSNMNINRSSVPLRPMCEYNPLSTRRPLPNHRLAHRLRHLLQTMPNSHRMDLCQCLRTESKVQGGQIYHWKD